MLTIYLRSYNKIVRNPDIKLFDELGYDDILWIDMLEPTIKEKRAVEDFLELSFQTQQQIEEIESSSRYSETEKATYCNTNFMVTNEGQLTTVPVSFVVSDGILITERSVELKTLTEAERKLQIGYKQHPTGFHILVSILEVRIDLDADMVENLSRQVAQLSKRITLEDSIDKDILKRISRLQDSSMMMRENIFDRQRVVSAIMKSDRFPNDTYPRLTMMIKDVESLLSHADFGLDRLDYLQDTALGLINIEQSNITKIFTVVSVFFLPATLIASFYGMNFQYIPGLHSKYGYLFSIALMIITALSTFWLFKSKKWL